MKAIINVRIFDYQNYIENGYVIFDKQINKVGKMSDFKDDSYEIIDGNGKLLMPSFVCAHSHIYSIFVRGLSVPFAPKNFVEILEQMWWKIDSKINNEITYYSGIAASQEFLLNGVTTIIDHHASGEIRGSLQSLKKAVSDVAHLRGIYCFETSDRYDVDACIKENAIFIKNNCSKNASGLFGMHASMTLSNDTLSKIKSALGDSPIHVHVAESKMDEEDSFAKYGKTIIERFDEYGLINKDSLIVHGVSLCDKELDILANRDVYLVVNVTSNMNNAVGLPNVKNYIGHNLKVMVGNDGLSSNMASEYMNILYTSHLFNNSPTKLNLSDVSKIIQNSYEYVSRRLAIKLGRIEKDYVADFMLVPYSPFTFMDKDNAFGHIFYGLFPNFKPSDVFINGAHEVNNYILTNKKLIEEFGKTQKYANKLWTLVKEGK